MRVMNLINSVVLANVTFLAACTSHIPDSKQYSGFLDSYSELQEENSATGMPILRWVSPDFKLSEYDNIIIEPIVYYPQPTPTPQVDRELLNEVLNYTNNQMKKSTGQHISLSNKVTPRTLIFRGAISAVNTSNEGMQFYEVLPIAMVLAGIEVATGHRTQDTNIFFEGELLDATTQQPVIKIVRKGMGKQISNAQKKLTFDMFKPIIDKVAEDAKRFLQS